MKKMYPKTKTIGAGSKIIQAKGHPQIKKLFWILFGISRGAKNRINLVSMLRSKPLNANKLSIELGLDYKAVQHHLELLEKNQLIVKDRSSYIATYARSTLLEANMDVFNEIAKVISNR